MTRAILLLVAFWLRAPPWLPIDAIARYASDDLEAVEVLVWMEHESDFGRMRHSSYAACDWGILQLHGRPDLEGPERDAESVRVWLAIKHANAKLCGNDGLPALNSGYCDRGTKLADERRAEAEWLDVMADYMLGRPPETSDRP